MSRDSMMKKLGLEEKDFKPKDVSEEERLTDLEDGLMALMEMVFGGDN